MAEDETAAGEETAAEASGEEQQPASEEAAPSSNEQAGNDNVHAELNVVVSPGIFGSAAAYFSVRGKEPDNTLSSVSLSFRLVDEEGVESESLGGATFNGLGNEASGNAGMAVRIIPRVHQPQAVLSGMVTTSQGPEMFFFVKDIPV
ncbi:MAG: hypothetical protein AAF560_19060 [Acidobacteriota bacterium]